MKIHAISRAAIPALLMLPLVLLASRSSGAEDSLITKMKRAERELTAKAQQMDPEFARLSAELEDTKSQLRQMTDAFALPETEITSPAQMDSFMQMLQQDANDLQDRLSKTVGYQRLMAWEASRFRQILDSAPRPASTAAVIPTFTFQAVRDPSVSSSTFPDGTLRNWIDVGVAWIVAYAKQANGGVYPFYYSVASSVLSYNLTGCSTVTVPWLGGGKTHYVYFRYNETRMNGWSDGCGTYALIDISPSYTCAGFWYPNWLDNVATEHEIGHILGQEHADCAWYNPYKYNDNECGSNGNNTKCSRAYDTCNQESCDSTRYCNQEYYDAYYKTARVICTNDSKQTLDYCANQQQSFTFHLCSGWNQVTFPVIPDNASLSAIFSPYGRYQVYDAATGTWKDATIAEPGKAYWVFRSYSMSESYTVRGWPVNINREQLVLSLKPGYNAIVPGITHIDLNGIPTNGVSWLNCATGFFETPNPLVLHPGTWYWFNKV